MVNDMKFANYRFIYGFNNDDLDCYYFYNTHKEMMGEYFECGCYGSIWYYDEKTLEWVQEN